MKRRGFFGLLAGAAVAGPGMVKEAAAASLSDLSLAGMADAVGMGTIGGGYPSSQTIPGPWDGDWRVGRLAKLGLRSAAEHSFHINRQTVHSIDPDLETYRSFALHRKISIQRERNYWRELDGEKNWLSAYITGLLKDD